MTKTVLADPVVTEVIRNAFISAAEEMDSSLVRSAYTPLIYESRDCSVALFDAEGRLLGQAAGLPLFLGNLEAVIHVTTDKFGLDAYAPGDVYIVNDSYLTGTHLGDISILAPVFWRDELVGFTVSRAHWIDIGSKDRGGTVDSTEIYQEGLRIPPTRLVQQGEFVRDVVDLLLLNSRMPREIYGDMGAQIAACRIGARRFEAILDRFGPDVVASAVEQVFEQSERMDRAAVEAIPDGVYEAHGWLDNDGRTADRVTVRVRVEVEGDEMTIDLDGSSPPAAGCVNCGEAQTISACRVAFKMITNPHSAVSGGSFRPLKVKVPPASVLAAAAPSACQYYFSPLGLLVDLVMAALAPAMPDRVAAGHHGDSKLLFLRSKDFALHDNNRGGWGGNAVGDGESALINVISGASRSLPVELIETKFPLLVRRYGLEPDTGGAGRHRGGLASVREIEVLGDGLELSLWFDRSTMPGWGLFGGHDGAPSRVDLHMPGEDERIVRKLAAVPVRPGTVTVAHSGGGGGFGPPLERPPALVRDDVVDGYVTQAAALSEYGVVLTDELEVDGAGTASARRELEARSAT